MSLSKKLLQEQDEALEEIRSYKAKMKEIRDGLTGGIVPWAVINEIKEGEPFMLLPGIVSYRLRSASPDVVILKVVMGPRSKFDLHGHDCPELGQLWSGDVKVNNLSLSKLGTFYFDAEEEHELYSEEGCDLIVQFPRPTAYLPPLLSRPYGHLPLP